MDFSGHIWLEKTRIWVQSGFFVLFLSAFALSLGALRASRPRRRVRGLCIALMGAPLVMWGTGTTLEMMRRVAHVSALWPLILSIGAFSFLLAGVFVLMREWFGARGQLDGARVAWTLALLTFAGWFFGGFSLEWNCLFSFAPNDYERVRFPDGWVLMLCGAQLLGAAKIVQSPHEPARRVLNPKVATWWLLIFSLLVAHPRIGNAPLAATAALCGFLPFLLKSWGRRRRFNRRARRVWLVLSTITVVMPLLLWMHSPFSEVAARVGATWKSVYSLLLLAFGLLVWQLATRFRPALRRALRERFSGRSLLVGCAFGSVASLLLFGPPGALFFAFWPLAGLFFDLLRVDASDPNSTEFDPVSEFTPDAELEVVEAD